MQRGATGGQHLKGGTAGKQRGDQISDCSQEVLAVIHHEQDLAWAEVVNQFIRYRSSFRQRQIEGRNYRLCHQPRFGQWSQVDPDDAIGKVGGNVTGGGQSQSRLARATRAGQGQQWDGLIEEERPGQASLLLPADQSGPWDGRGFGLKR